MNFLLITSDCLEQYFLIIFSDFVGGGFSFMERIMGTRKESHGKQRISTPWSTHKTY
jgi:hypothetical protein